MALWFSQEIVASDSLYELFSNAASRLRDTFADEIPELNEIRFTHRFGNQQISVAVNTSYADLIYAGEYTELDSLNELFRTEVTDIWSHESAGVVYIELGYPGFLNVDTLFTRYRLRPGVEYCSGSLDIPDHPNLYPWRLDDGTTTFLLRDAWGDCYNGCIFSHFWYFRVHEESVELVGEWDTSVSPVEPEWWDEAKAAYYYYGFRPFFDDFYAFP
jgi:hypothetical protein